MRIALDTETFKIGPGAIAPKLVCLSAACQNERGKLNTILYANGDPELLAFLVEVFKSNDEIIFHNAKFDLGVIFKTDPDLFGPLIFDKLDRGLVSDTMIREQLITLERTGDLEFCFLPDGSKRPLSYSLNALELKYLGIDRTEDKKSLDSWRMRYNTLDGYAARDYPPEASKYALQDAVSTYEVWHAQREFCNLQGIEMRTEEFQVSVDFCLKLMTLHGFKIDLLAKAEIEAEMARELCPENLSLLVAGGYLKPAEPERPSKLNPQKMTLPQPEKMSSVKLRQLVKSVCETNKIECKLTETGQTSLKADWLDDLAHLDPVIAQYVHRAHLQKIVTTELPRMSAEVIHPDYKVLVETGRTSSYASDLYPSGNIQNVDPRVRKCYVPRDGWLLYSCDFSALELVTTAQTCFDIFGKSILRDVINAGKDPHAWLGSQLALHLHDGFRETCNGLDDEKVFQTFLACKKHEDQEVKDFFKHFRTFAKPTGLGYPGGLGPETFISYAKAGYGISVDLQTAELLRKVWFDTYPEMRLYHQWVQQQQDPGNQGAFFYETPLGMIRSGCSFCSIANGKAMQSPGAEGAKLAVWNVVRASYDPTMKSILLGTKPLAFIHDEIIGEVPDDEFASERACEVSRLMVEALSVIVKDVKVSAQASLMRRWSKSAEPVFQDGKLIPWEEDNG